MTEAPSPLYEDPELLVFDKPSGMPLFADRTGAIDLWSLLNRRYGKLYQVHRIDKGTSGVLAIARSQALQTELTRQFANRTVHKFYLARTTGALVVPTTRSIDLPLRKGRKSRYRVAARREAIATTSAGWTVQPDDGAPGHPARTLVRTLATDGRSSLLLLKPLTGRTHQLRVHLAWIGHPILGDHLYGRPDAPDQSAPRLMLHAHRLILPGIGRFTAPVDAALLV